MAKYALINIMTGVLTGGFIESSLIGSLPANAVGPLTEAQWNQWVNNPAGYIWTADVFTAVAPSTPAATGYSTRAAGVTVHSTGTASINSTYPCDPLTVADLSAKFSYVVAETAFPGGLSSLIVADINGVNRSFATTVLFKNFVLAVLNFVTLCQQYDLGAAGVTTLPGLQTIS